MTVLIYGEHTEGKFKKGVYEAATFARKMAGDGQVHALVLGQVAEDEAKKLGKYGVNTIHTNADEAFSTFEYRTFSAAMQAAWQATGAQVVALPQSYNGRAIAPHLAVKLEAPLFSGVHKLPEMDGESAKVLRVVYSNKGIQTLSGSGSPLLFTLKPNAFNPEEAPVEASLQSIDLSVTRPEGYTVKEVQRRTGEISLTEAEVVVSAGRGMKGPENWTIIEHLADELNAATACSKPVSDIGWRPHHEHVGQTGIQIAPNLYIAVGISGAIQHLAGVSASKTIIVVNSDKEAPFFKAADYGVIGDAFEIVPRLLDAVKAYKASH